MLGDFLSVVSSQVAAKLVRAQWYSILGTICAIAVKYMIMELLFLQSLILFSPSKERGHQGRYIIQNVQQRALP
jgi:hypothetical protein